MQDANDAEDEGRRCAEGFLDEVSVPVWSSQNDGPSLRGDILLLLSRVVSACRGN